MRKPAKQVQLTHPIFREIIGSAEQKGAWFIYGVDKNGKTALALMLARDIAQSERTAYISAEEGTDKSFTDACKRAGITTGDRIAWDDYLSIDEIIEKYSRPKSARVIFIDNLTIYQDEIKPSELKKRLIDGLPNKLLILIGHEERNQPYPALARMACKMAKVVIRIKGLRAFVVSRFGPGGEIDIDPEKSQLFWGDRKESLKDNANHNTYHHE